MNPHKDDIVGDFENERTGRFLETKKAEYDAWLAHEQALDSVRGQHITLSTEVVSREQEVEQLRGIVPAYRAADIPAAILFALRNQPFGVSGIDAVAQKLSGGLVLKQFGGDILKLAETDLRVAQEKLAEFKKTYSKILKELKLT